MIISNFSFPKINFQANKGIQKPIMTGVDYSSIDTFERSDGFKTEFQKAAKEGKLTPEMIERVILDRIPRTIERVEKFSLEHPEIDKDDLLEETILSVVEAANRYKGQSAIGQYLFNSETASLEQIQKRQAKQDKCINTGLDDTLFSTSDDPVLDEVLGIDCCEKIEDRLDTLTPRQKQVLGLRYGVIGHDRGHTFDEIANEYNVTRDRIRQIHEKALRCMRHPSRSKLFKDYLSNFTASPGWWYENKYPIISTNSDAQEEDSFTSLLDDFDLDYDFDLDFDDL